MCPFSFILILHPTKLSSWYSVPRKTVEKRGGSGLFYHHATLGTALKSAYPDYPWKTEKFLELGRVPRGYWTDKTLLAALNKVEPKMGISKVQF